MSPIPFDKLTGRSGMTDAENELLAATCKDSRVHVEIGCLWGASAIAAALGGAQKVYTIDPMRGGWWDCEDPAVHKRPTRAIVDANFAAYGLSERIEVRQTFSLPWPLPGVQPDTFLIDGDHSYQGTLTDWMLATRYAWRAILVHDYDDQHPGVKQLVDQVARKTPGWTLTKQADRLAVFERTGPRVSVIVPTFNRPALLRRALDSVKAQTFTDYEIIVINDGGMEVAEVVAGYPGARLVEHGRNWGPAGAKNTGLRLARGMYVAYLDDDDQYYPWHLEKLMAAIDKGARFVYSDSNVNKSGEPVHLWFSRDWRNIRKEPAFATCSALHERRLLLEAGVFDELLPDHEDWDLWIRMSKVTDFVHVAEATTLVDRSGLSINSNAAALAKGRDVVQARYA